MTLIDVSASHTSVFHVYLICTLCVCHQHLIVISLSYSDLVTLSGPMTPEKTSYLEDMRSQLGLTKEQGDKLMKQVRPSQMGCDHK
jgi:hypothetical protein